MSSRVYQKKIFTFTNDLVMLDFSFTVLSTQTSNTANYKCTNVTGDGIVSIALVATGTYQITLQDNYVKTLGYYFTSSTINTTHTAIASLSSGVVYVIDTMGTSAQADWVTAGLSSYITAKVGVAFVAGSGASGSTGTGYASAQVTNGIAQICVTGNPDTTINASATSQSYFLITTLAATSSSSTTLVATTPADNTVITGRLFLRNSNIKGQGETQ